MTLSLRLHWSRSNYLNLSERQLIGVFTSVRTALTPSEQRANYEHL
ncbi:hypothetical protein [Aliamphritea spongicola]|nr:hypothetical protein [Aliamphritea spongicola]